MHDSGSGGSGYRPPEAAIDMTDKINGFFGEMEKEVNRAVKKFKELVKNLNDSLEWIPDPALYAIQRDLDELRKLLKKVIGWVEYAMKRHAPVISLIYASFAWVDEVKTPVSKVVNDIEEPADWDIIQTWDAPAKKVYEHVQKDQLAATAAIRDNAELASSWLMKIAKQNVDFAAQLASIAFEVAGIIAEAAVEAGSFIGALEAVGTAASLVNKAIVTVGSVMAEIVKRFVEAVSNGRDLYSVRKDESVFEADGTWPAAVTI